VNVHTLDYWRYRLGGRPARKAARSKSKTLVPIVVKERRGVALTSPATVEIALASGVQVRAPTSTDAHWLANLVRGLGGC
jgi:hypothetical protein